MRLERTVVNPVVRQQARLPMSDEDLEQLVLGSLSRIANAAIDYTGKNRRWPDADQIYGAVLDSPFKTEWNPFGDSRDPNSRLLVWLMGPKLTSPPDMKGDYILGYIPFPPGKVCVGFTTQQPIAVPADEWEAFVATAKANKQWPPDW